MSLQTGTCQLLSLHPDSLISAKAMLTGFCSRKKKNHVAIVRFVSFVLLDLNMFGIIFWTLIQSNSKKPGLNY